MSNPGDKDSGGKGAGEWTAPRRARQRTTFQSLPQFAGAALAPATAGPLLSFLKTQISQLRIEEAGSGIRYEMVYAVLPETLRSAWIVKIDHVVLGQVQFLVGQTRSTWVLVYDQPPEKLYEDPRFMNIDLKRRDVTVTAKAKRMYVSRIERSDLDRLNAIAAQDARRGGKGEESLAPTAGGFVMKETLERLQQCRVRQASDPGFDLRAFIARIHFMTPTQSGGGDYYYIDAIDGNKSIICELHVGRDPRHRSATYGTKAMLQYRSELCFLYLDIQYG